jgi:hypothetical protein
VKAENEVKEEVSRVTKSERVEIIKSERVIF